jgi:hypothetical protein
MNRTKTLLPLLPLASLAALAACSAAPAEPQDENVAAQSAALDPNQVIPPTTYSIELTEVDVLNATEPYDAQRQTGATTLPLPRQVGDYCPAWTPDTGYVDWAQIGYRVDRNGGASRGDPITTACSLGNAPTGAHLATCAGGAQNNGAFNVGQRLSLHPTVDAGDRVVLALAMDNIEAADVNLLASAMHDNLATAAATGGDGIQIVGNVLQAIGGVGYGVLGPIGSVTGAVGSLLSLGGDLLSASAPTGGCASPAPQASSCVGGLLGDAKWDGKLPYSDLWLDQGAPPPDTMQLGPFTAEQLQNMTSAGPVTIDFYPSMHGIEERMRFDDNAPGHDYGCASSLHVRITIDRDWSTGPASSAKSGDMAVLRAPGTIDVFASDPAQQKQLVHHWGNGASFGSELEAPAQTLEANGVSLSTSPVAVSRTTSNLDMFYADAAGGLYTVYQSAPSYTWYTQTLVAPGYSIPYGRFGHVWVPSIVPANAYVGATARSPQNLDVFVAGTDGNVYTTYWNAQMGKDAAAKWGAPFTVTTGPCLSTTRACAGSAVPGSPIAAVARNPYQIDIFYVGVDGGIWTSWWTAGQPWTTMEIQGPSSQVQYSPSAIATPGAAITATARDAQRLDVFLVGLDGGLWTSAWHGGGGWGTFEIPGTAHLGVSGGPISAVARQEAALDVVFVGANGGLEWSAWTAHQPWITSTVAVAGGLSSSMLGRGGLSIVAPTSFQLQAFYLNGWHQLDTVTWSDPTQCNQLAAAGCTTTSSTFGWSGPWNLAPPQ